MEEEFDIKHALLAFDRITSNGEQEGDSYYWSGVTAWSDRGGYTIVLSDEHVKLTINFHSTWEFEADNSHLVDEFVNKLNRIAAHKPAP